jgi:hypothetical protein
MPQSLPKILILIYSTKNRERVLGDGMRDELHKYTAAVLKEWHSPMRKVLAAPKNRPTPWPPYLAERNLNSKR